MDPFLGMIAMFGFNFAPRNWALCTGQLLPIRQYSALYALLGVQYGGDGVNTFAIPDLQGRAPIGVGRGDNLTNYMQGQKTGTENNTLLSINLPAHSHSIVATTESGDTGSPAGAYLANTGLLDKEYKSAAVTKVVMNASMVSQEGGGQPFSIMQPYLVLNYCISLTGIFPQRP